jgi:4-hydroxybenzoate polyprenyltransferase
VTRAARLVVMMVRPPVALVLLLFGALGLASAGTGAADGFHPLFTTVLVTVGAWFVNATVLNDLADEDIDRINLSGARGRPLVSGDATRAELLALGLGGGVLALVVGTAVDWRVGAVVVAGLVLNAAYSLPPVRLCARGALALVLLPLGYVAVPFLVGALSVRQSLDGRQLALLAGLYVTFMGRIVLKDFRDVTGDELYGKRTFLLRHGRQVTCAASAACWVAGSLALLALVPLRSMLVAAFVVFAGCALHGLRALERATGHVEEQVTIAAIAQVGRGMCITVLAHLTMVAKGWPPGAQTAAVLVLAALFAGAYAGTVGQRRRVPAELVRPY